MYDFIIKIMETQARTMDKILDILEKTDNELNELKARIDYFEKELELLKNKSK